MQTQTCEKLIDRLQSMDRPAIVAMLRNMRCGFPMDFTEDYLSGMSIERLRHVALAACLHAEPAAENAVRSSLGLAT